MLAKELNLVKGKGKKDLRVYVLCVYLERYIPTSDAQQIDGKFQFISNVLGLL